MFRHWKVTWKGTELGSCHFISLRGGKTANSFSGGRKSAWFIHQAFKPCLAQKIMRWWHAKSQKQQGRGIFSIRWTTCINTNLTWQKKPQKETVPWVQSSTVSTFVPPPLVFWDAERLSSLKLRFETGFPSSISTPFGLLSVLIHLRSPKLNAQIQPFYTPYSSECLLYRSNGSVWFLYSQSHTNQTPETCLVEFKKGAI